eukprot:5583755-Amphidinium_carterae.1
MELNHPLQPTLPVTETQIAIHNAAAPIDAPLPASSAPPTAGTAGPANMLPPTLRDTVPNSAPQPGGFGPSPSTAATRPQPYPSPHPQSAWDVQ